MLHAQIFVGLLFNPLTLLDDRSSLALRRV